MSKQCLDVQQMQHLQELGMELDYNTVLSWILDERGKDKPLLYISSEAVDYVDFCHYCLPAYTLQDVIDALPKEILYENKRCWASIDPPGTINHCKEKGVEVLQPNMKFFDIVKKNGFPTRRARLCCSHLKEYKVLNFAIQGIRKSESKAREERYKEPIICRIYGAKKNNVQVVLPILDWTNEDVEEFINVRGIKCHPLYYNEGGTFNVKKRLGCMACPLKSKQLEDFEKYPNLAKAWIRAGKVWWNTHPNANSHKKFESIYDLFVHNVFFDSYAKFREWKYNLFETVDCKKFLEDYFKIKL